MWHPSQEIAAQPDGSVLLRLNVSNDWPLRSWILGFGPLARVMSPPALAAQIRDEIERAAALYRTASEVSG
jgi:predicted DNA-binding transcriptional regulator YafY